MKKILLVTDGILHPPLLGRLALRKALQRMEGFAFGRAPSIENLPANVDDYDAMVLYFHHKHISEKALNALALFVSAGGGLLAIHSATASFKEAMPYFEILGGRFIGHGALGALEIRPTGGKGEEDPFRGIGAFIVKDELYMHELQGGIHVHFTAGQGGEEAPAVWTYHYGQGRVCYAMLGHCAATLRHPNYQQILRGGLAWVGQS